MSTDQPKADLEVAQEVTEIGNSAMNCVDRGVDPVSGKRGKKHLFVNNSDKCLCEDMDLSKQRMK